MVDQDECPRPERDHPRSPEQRLTDQHHRHTADHRVADMPIRTNSYQFLRRVPRSQSPLPDDGEQVDAPDEEHQPDPYEQGACYQAHPRHPDPAGIVLREGIEQPDGYDNDHNNRKQENGKDMSQGFYHEQKV